MEEEEMDLDQENLQVDLEDLKDLHQEVVMVFKTLHNYLVAVVQEHQEEMLEVVQVVVGEVQEILILQ
jgi:hypothetical protein